MLRIDASAIERLAQSKALSPENQDKALARTLNKVGDYAYTRVVRTLVTETGMKPARVRKTLVKRKAVAGQRMQYEMRARDIYTTLKDFGVRQVAGGTVVRTAAGNLALRHGRGRAMALSEGKLGHTSGGVVSSPWHKTRLFPGAFIGPGGHAYIREGRKRTPIRKLYGPSLPREIARGQTKSVVDAVMTQRFMPELVTQITLELARMKSS